jgi:hypothetical protein
LIIGSLIGGYRIYLYRLDKNQKEHHREVAIETNKANKKESPKREPAKPVVTEEIDTSQPADEPTESVVVLIENESAGAEPVKEAVESKNLNPVYLAQSKSLFNSSNFSIENLPAGKSYFQGENGRLESVVSKTDDGISERLVSYDYHGQKSDDLEIGRIDGAGRVVKYTIISGNRISVFELVTDEKGKKTEEKVTEFLITPQLKFNKGKTYSKLRVSSDK